jgi:SAM-dependent methyltransferase
MNDPLQPPRHIQRSLQDIREQEAARIIADLVGQRQTILNVGPSWGRDYHHLTKLGKHVINADIAPQQHLRSFVIRDVTSGLPFADLSFDVVVVAEVLEHLLDDVAALAEARRVLRESGILVVTVPFFNDRPEFHVRIHSPRSIRRLLQGAAFEPISYIVRGGLISWPKAIHALRRLCGAIIEPEKFNAIVVGIDKMLSRRAAQILRFSSGYGCYIACTKTEARDFRQVNIHEFTH